MLDARLSIALVYELRSALHRCTPSLIRELWASFRYVIYYVNYSY